MSLRWQKSIACMAVLIAGAGCKSTQPKETPIPEKPPAASESVAPSSSSGGSHAASDAADSSRTASVTSASVAPSHPRVYVVKQHDTLFSIARLNYNGDASKWRAIYEANRDKIPDKDHIKVGQELVLPD